MRSYDWQSCRGGNRLGATNHRGNRTAGSSISVSSPTGIMGWGCPGRQKSTGVSSSDRSAKDNRSMRRLLNQLAHAAVRKQDCQFQIVFRRLSARLGYAKAVWAIAHRLCQLIWKVLHEGVPYVEYGPAPTPLSLKRRRQRLVTQLKKLGYQVQLTPVVSDARRV
jgi:hypothetical protein